jgi:tRNA(Ile)-lysidine synthase
VSERRPARPDAASERLTPPKRFDTAWLRGQLRSLIGTLRNRMLCIAYSGGMDSCALLCALASLRKREGFALRALHVNHQLQPLAERWAREAQSTARRLGVPCEVLKVKINRGRGESLEAAARTARYRALLRRLRPAELLLTAHHQEDQFETVLLALMRGSGVRGLSAMSLITPLAQTQLLRPLLPITRSELERYLKRRAMTWSEDPSNADERFDRNYLRRCVVPLLRARWPAAAATASRSASLLSEASAMLERLAREHLRQARDGRALCVSVLRRLPVPERVSALRAWLSEQALPMPDHARMREIAGPMLAARPDAMPSVSWPGAQLRRHGDRLLAYGEQEMPLAAQASEVERWDWRAQPWLSLGSAGSLGLVRERHGDVRLAALPRVLSVRYRLGGERLVGGQGRFALKDLLQKKGLVPWQREQVPLVVHEDSIVAVADLWLCPGFAASPGSTCARGRFRWRQRGAE